jgi:hypothetical protein
VKKAASLREGQEGTERRRRGGGREGEERGGSEGEKDMVRGVGFGSSGDLSIAAFFSLVGPHAPPAVAPYHEHLMSTLRTCFASSFRPPRGKWGGGRGERERES